jgi:carbohydrate-binding DOMON domain-containing protein
MNEIEHHEELIRGISKQMKPILESSEQAIYIYLDDVHKVCNKKFASLLGYGSPDEWARVEEPMLEVSVDKRSQETLVETYNRAMEKMTGSTISVTWKKKSGGTVDTTVILVPIAYVGTLFALHFVS